MPYGTNAVIIEAYANVNVDEAPHTDKKHHLGFAVHDDQGRRYRYAQFGDAVEQYDAVAMTVGADPFDDVVVVTDLKVTVLGVYFNETAAAQDDYGWIIDEGVVIVKTSSVTAATSIALGASATDGTLTDISATDQDPTQDELDRMIATSTKGIKALTDTDTPVTGTSYAVLF